MRLPALPARLYRNKVLRGLCLPILLLLLWEFASRLGQRYAYSFTSLESIWLSLLELLGNGELLLHLGASLSTTCLGLLLGGSAGLLVGASMGLSRSADQLIGPLYHAWRPIPTLGLIPLIALWLGNGEEAKLLIVCLAAFEPMVLNTQQGLRHAERRYLEVGHTLAFSRWQALRHIQLPSALPSVLTGITHALGFCWIATIGCELLFTVGPGLGGLMEQAQQGGRMEVIALCVMLISLMGFAMNHSLNRVSRHLLRWRPTRASKP